MGGHVDAVLVARGRWVLVAGAGESADEVVGDMIEVLTGVCAGLFGCRGARYRVVRAMTAAENAGVVGGA